MKSLILHPTATSQWYALVNEAEVSANLVLHEDTESYLVFLLMRFTQGTQLADSILAIDFLHALHANKHRRAELMRDIGDKSLLFSGLFPEIAQKRRVSIDYFTGMGQNAYLSAGELYEQPAAELYYALSYHFLDLQLILRAMCNHHKF
jgi:hypothetical protein